MGGSIDEKTILEAHEELTCSSAATDDVEALHLQSLPDVAYSWISKNIWRRRTPRRFYIVLFNAKITMLLPFGPLAIWLHIFTQNQGWVLVFSLLGMAPLTERLGYVTRQLSLHTKPTVGRHINVTFVTVSDIITSLFALSKGMTRVVQISLLGSILLNMLLVIGWAFFTGGIIHGKKVQVFNKQHAQVNVRLLLMALMGIMLPTVLHFTHSEVHFGKSELSRSRFSSCVMLVAYASFLFFKFISHRHLYRLTDEDEEGVQDKDSSPEITVNVALGWFCFFVLWVSILSSYLLDAIEGASASLNIPVAFISAILLPVVGNIWSIMFSMSEKLDLTLGVAIGLSTQTAMFTIPFCVVVGWIIGKPMDLNFELFETAILAMAVLVVVFILQAMFSC
ncbi:PREDICTED: vacuolar cation/proton exchanger 2-like [Fragaria vesca subsp. vesca]|uniref:vacuolar cation/proton exchanger 2-like isoform X2 n=1 Tax=Fragaria vesca subsp. vesca TaxID=101020 RepID=UPI0002C34DFB|nr:PREDICTED: vacuolar cation/proton exchanger 2-like isoform X2 [Fragaria vesca subsp. vesca]